MSTKKTDDEKVSSAAPFGLRMLPDLKDRIAAAAAANGRSMNAEIVARLTESFSAFHEPVDMVNLLATLQQHNAELVEIRMTPAGTREIVMRQRSDGKPVQYFGYELDDDAPINAEDIVPMKTILSKNKDQS